jgi:methylamine--corrinoid protein Co-methyltransferase
VEKYKIEADYEDLVVNDDTADDVFNAGVELLSEVGVYQMDTQRVIKFSKEEIMEVANEYKANPAKAVFGKGDDEMVIEYRTCDDKKPPVLYSGPPAVAAQEWFGAYVQSFAQEETVVGMGILPGLATLDGLECKTGTLSEFHVALWEQKKIREVLENVGRPGMNLGLIATASELGAIFACIKPGLREAYNTQIGVHIIPEMKMDWAALIKSQFCHDRDIKPWQSAMSLIGGLCRNAVDVGVTMTANVLAQLSYGRGPTISIFPNHMDGRWGTPQSMWAFSATARACERNVKVATGSCVCGSPWRTPVALMQAAAVATIYTNSGLAYSWIAGHTGLEARLIGEMLKAAVGMDKAKASELALKILARVEEMKKDMTSMDAVPFPEVYDVETVKPKPEYEAALMKIKEELAGMGFPY